MRDSSDPTILDGPVFESHPRTRGEIMNLGDESLLSAYLDDELDPARRLSVETALLADPRLVERLQQLASIRSTIAAVPRPLAPCDVSGPILLRVEALPSVRIRKVIQLDPARRGIKLAGACLSAAAILLLASPWLVPPIQNPAPGDAGARSGVIDLSHDLPPWVAPATDQPDPADRTEIANAAVPDPSTSDLNSSRALPGDSSEDHDLVQAYLDRGEVRRLVLVVDTLTPRSIDDIRGVIQETGRSDPILGELRIAQGIEIDAANPQEAVVFLVVLDDREFQHLNENLQARDFQPTLDEHSMPAQVVAQLADVDIVDLTLGIPTPALRPVPPEALASLRLAARTTGELAPSAHKDTTGSGLDALPGNLSHSGGETTAAIDKPALEDTSSAFSRSPVELTGRVCLVWVTTRPAVRRPTPM